MDLQLKDKVVLITGGAKGIGAAITRGCAREGAVPVFVDKDVEAGKQLQAELRSGGATCGLICADLVSVENCAAAVEQTLREFGRLDVLVKDRKSTRLNSSHSQISYAVFCLKKKKNKNN